jgi:hypothetical protein
MDQRAGQALVNWDAALVDAHPVPFFPLGEVFGQIGDWEPENAALRDGLAAGLVIFGSPQLHVDPPAATAVVVWSSGATVSLPTLSAQDAYDFPQLPVRPCDNCRQVMLVDAHLSQARLPTTRGPATVPVWEYTVDHSKVRLTRPAVAVPSVKVASLPVGPAEPTMQIQVNAARGSVSGLALTAGITGDRLGADQACGTGYAVEAIESATAVVLVAHQARYLDRFPDAICASAPTEVTVSATLRKPLAERTVLDGLTGQPVGTVRLP